MPLHIFALVAFCIVTETLSVSCFKRGVDDKKPLLALGILLWGVEFIAWILVLEEVPLSVAFPMMSLVYCTVPLAGKLLLGEKLPRRQWLATALITLGVAIVGSTGI